MGTAADPKPLPDLPSPAPRDPGRRAFLGGLGALAAAAALPASGGALLGCGPGGDEEDARRLEARIAAERARAGQGPLGERVFRGYRGLAELPEFALGADGRLRCVASGVDGAVDVHTHLGIAVLLAPGIDLTRRTERVRYFLDCDDPELPEPCRLDLDVYINDNFTRPMRRRLTIEQLRQAFLGSTFARTHTAANLVEELERMRFGHAAVLPIDLGLPFGDDTTFTWIEAIDALEGAQAGAGADAGAPRLVPGASVHPRDPDKEAKLRRAASRGARIVKLHPEFQRFFPDAPEAMEVYALCEELGLPVIFHAGRSGIEPAQLRPYALLRHYEPAAAEFPELPFVFGHGGARDLPDAVGVARRRPNVWLGTSSLGVTVLGEAMEALGPERFVFGSDWPFYAVAAPLAKVLLLTRDDPAARRLVLRGNAERVLPRGTLRPASV
ncbi:MAG: amidohydrolase family protein [Myxococcota bacterium]|nr:amidohydrolase family protein [Myxococcota bacterium]